MWLNHCVFICPVVSKTLFRLMANWIFSGDVLGFGGPL